MPKANPDKPDGELSKSPNWTHAKTQCLINALIHQKLAGKKAATGFKKEAWTVVTTESNDTFKCNLKKTQLKNHFQPTKGQYSIVHGLRNTSGAGRDKTTQMVTGEPAFWTNNNLRRCCLQEESIFYDLMNKLCGNVNATANGIIGAQTATPPIIEQAIDPPANNPVATNQSAEECPANNCLDPSDGLEDEGDNGFCLPPELKHRGLDEPHPRSEHSSDNSDGPITQTATPATPKPHSS
ncbi:Myb/SANT-like DNA-binding domain-containing protein [Melampsora americana]|nr:Myb/SANT-like DNA-binding domain-containing protein [Melampsora americana]